MTRAVRLLTCVEGELETRLVELVGAAGNMEVTRRCADLAEVLAAGAAGAGTVVLLSPGLPGLDRVITADLRRHGLSLLGVHDVEGAAEEQVEHRFALAGVEVVHRVSDAAQLRAAVVACHQEPPAPAGAGIDPDELLHELEPAPPAGGRVVTVWGPVGSAGRSTVAVMLAARLTRAGRRVLLVDADTYAAGLAQILGVVDEAPGVAAACRAAHAGSLTGPALSSLAPRVPPGMQVLTGIPQADRWPEVTEAGVARLLEVARQTADVTVVDAGFCLESGDGDGFGPRRNGATLTAVQETDAVIAVGSADPVGLSRLVRGLAALPETTSAPVLAVANRLRRPVAGPDAEAQIEHLVSGLVRAVVTIGDDPTASTALAVDGAAALAQPVRGPLADGIDTLARRLVGLNVVPAGSAGLPVPRRRWWVPTRPRKPGPLPADVVDSSL